MARRKSVANRAPTRPAALAAGIAARTRSTMENTAGTADHISNTLPSITRDSASPLPKSGPPTAPTTATTTPTVGGQLGPGPSNPTPAPSVFDNEYYEATSCVPARQPAKKKPITTKNQGKEGVGGVAGSGTAGAMADPFEVRMRFTSQLQHLNASVTSAQKAAHYALRYRDMDEDLHSCILEQLERNNMNNRANIMYFIPHLCTLSTLEGHPEYTRFIQRDILKIIDLVAPDDGSGAANVKVVRKVLADLQSKNYLQPQTVVELEDCIKDRDAVGGEVGMADEGDGRGMNGVGEVRGKGTPGGMGVGSVRLDKRQIEQRIEEDRERHKRLRESIWAVGAGEGEEFEKLMDETSELGEDDFLEVDEEVGERRQGARFQALL